MDFLWESEVTSHAFPEISLYPGNDVNKNIMNRHSLYFCSESKFLSNFLIVNLTFVIFFGESEVTSHAFPEISLYPGNDVNKNIMNRHSVYFCSESEFLSNF